MRSRALLLALSLLVSAAASAQNTVRFDPPNPTSRTPIGGASVRVELVPLTDTGAARNGTGLKSAWGFVTVTNNETQHVTVISPH